MRHLLYSFTHWVIGSLLIIFGLVLLPSPIPLGWLFIVSGLYFLSKVSPVVVEKVAPIKAFFAQHLPIRNK